MALAGNLPVELLSISLEFLQERELWCSLLVLRFVSGRRLGATADFLERRIDIQQIGDQEGVWYLKKWYRERPSTRPPKWCRLLFVSLPLMLSTTRALVQHINFSKVKDCITDRCMSLVATYLPNLKSVNLAWCQRVSDVGLVELTQLPNLRAIHFAGGWRITDDGVIALARGAQFLESVDLSDCPKVTDLGARELSKLPRLTNLCLAGCLRVSLAALVDEIPLPKRLP